MPAIANRCFVLGELRKLLDQPSKIGSGALEGLYLRREDCGCLTSRAKLVRSEFVQAIDEHWSRRPLAKNQLEARGQEAKTARAKRS